MGVTLAASQLESTGICRNYILKSPISRTIDVRGGIGAVLSATLDALNAANARLGSLYDALYCSDAIPETDGATRAAINNSVAAALLTALWIPIILLIQNQTDVSVYYGGTSYAPWLLEGDV